MINFFYEFNTGGFQQMVFNGFQEKDFNVFKIEGLEQRMEKLISSLRPKLEALGEIYADELSAITGEEMYYHVAKHARRTVNPPKDTWVAFASNKRGYKMLPHFQIGLFETHVFVWFAIIYEAPVKGEYGKVLKKNLSKIKKAIPDHFVWSDDHMKPESFKHKDVKKEKLSEMATRLNTVKKAELLCGIHIPREEAVSMSSDDWNKLFHNTFQTLKPLYSLKKDLL
jgi:uncharacterized protein YktB (UPF0637 family)